MSAIMIVNDCFLFNWLILTLKIIYSCMKPLLRAKCGWLAPIKEKDGSLSKNETIDHMWFL